MHFPVLSDLVDRGRQLCFYAYLIAGGLYTTIGMVSLVALTSSEGKTSLRPGRPLPTGRYPTCGLNF